MFDLGTVRPFNQGSSMMPIFTRRIRIAATTFALGLGTASVIGFTAAPASAATHFNCGAIISLAPFSVTGLTCTGVNEGGPYFVGSSAVDAFYECEVLVGGRIGDMLVNVAATFSNCIEQS